MNVSESITSEQSDTKALVRSAAEAIVKMGLVEKLGAQMRIAGSERAILCGIFRVDSGNNVSNVTETALADFVPMAFVRVALANSGVSFPEHFGRKDSRARIRDYRRLDAEPIYREALALAQAWWPDRADDVRYVARWNWTMTWIEERLARGSKPSDLEFAPTLLNGPDEACPPLSERPTFPDRPWWLSQWMPKPWWKLW